MFKTTALASTVAAVILAVTVGPGLIEKSHQAAASMSELGATIASAEAFLGGDGAFEALAAGYDARVAAGSPVAEAGLFSAAELAEARERGLTVVIECAPGSDLVAMNVLLADVGAEEIRCLA